MELRRLLGSIRSSLRRRGLSGMLRQGVPARFRAVFPRRERPHPFDRQAGVDTGGLLGPETIAAGHPHDSQTTAYFGSQPSVFFGLMERWTGELAATGQALADFTFVDIGCGKGRVLLLASEFPFRAIVGVELSPLLAGVARNNVAHWNRSVHACSTLSVLQADVLDVPLPEGPALLFMYHPFEEELFERWVRSLLRDLATRASSLYLAYLNPVHEARLGLLPDAELLWTGEVPFTPAEAAVHRFRGVAERVSLYRLTAAGRHDGC